MDKLPGGARTEAPASLAAQRASAQEARAQVEPAPQEYRKPWLGITEEGPPFSLDENTWTTADRVAVGLEKRAQALETWAAQPGIQDTRGALKRFRAQIDALSRHVGFGWRWVEEIRRGWAVEEATQQGLTSQLLPVLYGYHQMQKTQNSRHRKRDREAWQRA